MYTAYRLVIYREYHPGYINPVEYTVIFEKSDMFTLNFYISLGLFGMNFFFSLLLILEKIIGLFKKNKNDDLEEEENAVGKK